MLQDAGKDDEEEEEDMSVGSDEEPQSYPIPAPVTQPKSIKPPAPRLRVSFYFQSIVEWFGLVVCF